ncbi:hypothetical protein [Alteromonas gracilis]|uniref:hypothetical protein n=1 Tax=Alteromonas gracilis TaxID=1479524 RepID=UPI00373686A4
MSKRFFNFMAILSFVAYLETSHLHYLGGQEFYGPLSTLTIILLFIPSVALIGWLLDSLVNIGKRNAIIVKVENNALNAYTLDISIALLC